LDNLIKELKRRQEMKKGFWGFGALGFMLTALLLAAVPAWAQSVDDKIKALEQELGQLKSQQVELKKEATAAQRCEHRSGGQVVGYPLRYRSSPSSIV
jgi:hypothetical protein